MTNTNPNAFKMFLSILPKEILDNTWFFPLRANSKQPDVPCGSVLKGNLKFRMDKYQAMDRLKHGQNVGIYALSGGLMFIDLDVENGKLKATNNFIKNLNDTFVVKTRNGGLQYYYLNNGIYPNQLLKENGETIGELRSDWYYVVSVGSYVNPDKDNKDGTGTYQVYGQKCPITHLQGFSGLKKNDSPKQVQKKEDFKVIMNDGKRDRLEYLKGLKTKGIIYKRRIK